MPATQLALRLEQQYGNAVARLWRRVLGVVRIQYGAVDPAAIEVGFRRFIALAAESIASGQREAQQLAQGFVQMYVETETGRAFRAAPMADIAGTTRDGASLRSALSGAVGVTWLRISQGLPAAEALQGGRAFVDRLASTAVSDGAERELEHQAERSRGLLRGWTWQVVGDSCVACLSQQTGQVRPWSIRTRRHSGCNCLRVPVPVGVGDDVPRPTGLEIFKQLSRADQAAAFKAAGAEKARAIRSGSAALGDFVETAVTARGLVITEAAA